MSEGNAELISACRLLKSKKPRSRSLALEQIRSLAPTLSDLDAIHGLLRALLQSVRSAPLSLLPRYTKLGASFVSQPAAFQAGLDALVPKFLKTSSNFRDLYFLQRFTLDFLGQLDADADGADGAAATIARTTAQVFEKAESFASSTQELRGLQRICEAVRQAAKPDSRLLNVIITETSVVPANHLLLLACVSSQCVPEGATRAALLSTCVDNLFAGRVSVPWDQHYELWKKFLHSLSHDDFAASIPAWDRGIKGATEPTASALASFVRATKLDLSRYISSLFQPAIEKHLVGKNDAVRESLVQVVGSLFSHCSEYEALEPLVQLLATLITTKRTSLPTWQQRKGIMDALVAAAGAVTPLSEDARSRLADMIVQATSTAAAKESHDRTKAAALDATARWTAKLMVIPAGTADMLIKGMRQPSKDMALAYVQSVAVLADEPALVRECGVFVDAFLELVEVASAKPHQVHPTGLLAVSALCKLASRDSAIAARLASASIAGLVARGTTAKGRGAAATPTKKPFWSIFTESNSFVYASQLMSWSGKSVADVTNLEEHLLAVVESIRLLFSNLAGSDAAAVRPLSGTSEVRELLTGEKEQDMLDVMHAAEEYEHTKVVAAIAELTAPTKAAKGAKPTGGAKAKRSVGAAGSDEPQTVFGLKLQSEAKMEVAPVATALVVLLSHPRAPVRAAAKAAIASMYKGCDELPLHLMYAFQDRLQSLVAQDEQSLSAFFTTAESSDAVHGQFDPSSLALTSRLGETAWFKSPVTGAALTNVDSSGVYTTVQSVAHLQAALEAVVSTPQQSASAPSGVTDLSAALGASLGLDMGSTGATLSLDTIEAILPAALLSCASPALSESLHHARRLWNRVYLNLCSLAGLKPILYADDGEAVSPGSQDNITNITIRCAPIDKLLQSEQFEMSLARIAFGARGLFSSSMTHRAAFINALKLLAEGTTWMTETKHAKNLLGNAATIPEDAAIVTGAGAGARAFVCRLYAASLNRLLPYMEHPISPAQAKIFESPHQTVCDIETDFADKFVAVDLTRPAELNTDPDSGLVVGGDAQFATGRVRPGKPPTGKGGVGAAAEDVQLLEQEELRNQAGRIYTRLNALVETARAIIHSSLTDEFTVAAIFPVLRFLQGHRLMHGVACNAQRELIAALLSEQGEQSGGADELSSGLMACLKVIADEEQRIRDCLAATNPDIRARATRLVLLQNHRRLLEQTMRMLVEVAGGSSDVEMSDALVVVASPVVNEFLIGCRVVASNLFSPAVRFFVDNMQLSPVARELMDLSLLQHDRTAKHTLTLSTAPSAAVELPIPMKSNADAGYVAAAVALQAAVASCSAFFAEENLESYGSVQASAAYMLRRLVRRNFARTALQVLAFAPRTQPSLAEAVRSICVGDDTETATDASAAPQCFALFELEAMFGDTGLLHPEAHVREAALVAIDAVLQQLVSQMKAGFDVPALSGAADEAAPREVPAADDRAAVLTQHLADGFRAVAHTWSQQTPDSPDHFKIQLWLAVHDAEQTNADHAQAIWQRLGFQLPESFTELIHPLLAHQDASIRAQAGRGLASGFTVYPAAATPMLKSLFEEYERFGQMAVKMEDFAIRHRKGVLAAVQACGAQRGLPPHMLPDTMSFLIAHGLSDGDVDVRADALQTAVAVVDCYGDAHAQTVIHQLETFMEDTSRSPLAAATESVRDLQREGAVILLGTAARHLSKGDTKITSIASTLVEMLNTPSEPVQRAVSKCLPPLAKSISPAESKALLDLLMERLLHADSFGARRGAAFGLGGVVKGLGLGALKANDLIPRLEAAGNSKVMTERQGAMFAFECLSESLGLLFEPYVIRIIPVLLKGLGEGAFQVRDAAQGASRLIMGKLSGHGVKLVLPGLLEGLNSTTWRSKQASIQLLGSMAYCAPKQLSSCLPQIVPSLCEAFSDTHPKVHEAGRAALQDIGGVIRNPEIAGIVPDLLEALYDPTEKTQNALNKLSATSFVHAIDPPSLALVIPILRRGMLSRQTSVKSGAALIVGNICSLIREPSDLLAYLDVVIPPLKKTLTDPIPDTRAVAARAFGGLIRGLGQAPFEDLVPWMIDMMQTGSSSVERSGGAQGLCEVLVALGEPTLSQVLAQVVPLADSTSVSAREAVMWVLAFLPTAMGDVFSAYINLVLPLVINGLSDDNDMVRDVALRAGQIIVDQHALSHTGHLLPPLKEGLLDENWRIRQCSLRLVGDLLVRVSGTKLNKPAVDGSDVEAESESDDETDMLMMAMDPTVERLEKALGRETRDQVLGLLFLMKTDVSNIVRQTATQVWQNIVSNTGRTLRLVLPALMDTLIELLASTNDDRRTVSGRCLGDIVKKVGDRVLPEIIPILREGLRSEDDNTRQGVCMGLSEVIGGCSRRQLEHYGNVMIPAVQDALCDPVPAVRKAAAQAFNVLNTMMAKDTVSQIVPSLLRLLETDDADVSSRAMFGLREVLVVRAKEVLPSLLPKLVAAPLTPFHARALAQVAQVTSATIHFHFNIILPAIVAALSGTETGGDASQPMSAVLTSPLSASARDVVCAVDSHGIQWMLTELLKSTQDANPRVRATSAWLIGEFCAGTPHNITDQIPRIFKDLLPRLNDAEPETLQVCSDAIKKLTTSIDMEEFMPHLDFIYNNMRSIISDAKFRRGSMSGDRDNFVLPAFALAKGLDGLLPVFQHALMKSSPENRAIAARGIGELVQSTDIKVLRGYLIKMTGPLIRVVGDKFPPEVKAAILSTLVNVIDKGGIMIKPFVSQLQTTFVKALSDEDRQVRSKGATALGKLMNMSPRVDPLVAQLTSGVLENGGGVQAAMMDALQNLLNYSGAKVSAPMRSKAIAALQPLLHHERGQVRKLAAGGLGSVLQHLDDDEVADLMEGCLLAPAAEWTAQHGKALALSYAVRYSASRMAPYADNLVELAGRYSGDDNAMVRQATCTLIGFIIGSGEAHGTGGGKAAAAATPTFDTSVLSQFIPVLAQLLADSTSEVRRAAAVAVKRFAKLAPDAAEHFLGEIIPPLFKVCKDFNLGVKLAAERALMHVLQAYSGEQRLVLFCKTADPLLAGQVTEYVRRVVKKLTPESDDDSDDEFAA